MNPIARLRAVVLALASRRHEPAAKADAPLDKPAPAPDRTADRWMGCLVNF